MISEYLSMGGTAICGLVGVKLATSVVGSLKRYSDQRGRARTRSQALQAELHRQFQQTNSSTELYSWQGWRKFRVESKIEEAPGCHSLTFVPHDGQPIPSFHPGQFITFSIRLPNESKPVVRCYSLSDAPSLDSYRCTVKKVPAATKDLPPGRISTYFNEALQVGDIVDVKAPSGKFYLDMSTDHPVVLIAGGVGITPMISMMNAVINENSRRTVYLFCGFRNRKDHLFYEHLRSAAAAHHNVHLHVAYSRPSENDVMGRDYHSQGYVDLDALRSHLPSNNFEYYLCGPPAFMSSVDKALRDWGVPNESIKSEAFGPAARPASRTGKSVSAANEQKTFSIEFARTGKKLTWNGEFQSLLDLADEHGIAIDSGCRAGNCATCSVAIKEGKIRHTETPDSPVSEGTCLTCLAVPESDLKIDA